MSEDRDHCESEVRRWMYLVELFSSRDGRVTINDEDKTADYRKWAEQNLAMTKALLDGTVQREAMSRGAAQAF